MRWELLFSVLDAFDPQRKGKPSTHSLLEFACINRFKTLSINNDDDDEKLELYRERRQNGIGYKK